MYSAPGTGTQWKDHHQATDPLRNEVREQMEDISEIAQLTLAQVLEDAERVYQDPEASAQQIRDAGKRVSDITKAAMESVNGLRDFQKGVAAEERIVEQALEHPTNPGAVEHRGQLFAREASTYFESAKSRMNKSARGLSMDPALDQALEFKYPGNKPADNRVTFWEKVSDVILGLEVMGQRALALPRLIVQQMVEGGKNGLAAVNAAGEAFEARAQREYADLKVGVRQVAMRAQEVQHKTEDVLGAGLDVGGRILGRMETAVSDRADRALDAIGRFITERAIPVIRRWAERLDATLESATTALTDDFQDALGKRRAGREQVAPVSTNKASVP